MVVSRSPHSFPLLRGCEAGWVLHPNRLHSFKPARAVQWRAMTRDNPTVWSGTAAQAVAQFGKSLIGCEFGVFDSTTGYKVTHLPYCGNGYGGNLRISFCCGSVNPGGTQHMFMPEADGMNLASLPGGAGGPPTPQGGTPRWQWRDNPTAFLPRDNPVLPPPMTDAEFAALKVNDEVIYIYPNYAHVPQGTVGRVTALDPKNMYARVCVSFGTGIGSWWFGPNWPPHDAYWLPQALGLPGRGSPTAQGQQGPVKTPRWSWRDNPTALAPNPSVVYAFSTLRPWTFVVFTKVQHATQSYDAHALITAGGVLACGDERLHGRKAHKALDALAGYVARNWGQPDRRRMERFARGIFGIAAGSPAWPVLILGDASTLTPAANIPDGVGRSPS